ncbi:hypothetical protein PSPO01_01443 [Paraphaeosphaeria sporulosa]
MRARARLLRAGCEAAEEAGHGAVGARSARSAATWERCSCNRRSASGAGNDYRRTAGRKWGGVDRGLEREMLRSWADSGVAVAHKVYTASETAGLGVAVAARVGIDVMRAHSDEGATFENLQTFVRCDGDDILT